LELPAYVCSVEQVRFTICPISLMLTDLLILKSTISRGPRKEDADVRWTDAYLHSYGRNEALTEVFNSMRETPLPGPCCLAEELRTTNLESKSALFTHTLGESKLVLENTYWDQSEERCTLAIESVGEQLTRTDSPSKTIFGLESSTKMGSAAFGSSTSKGAAHASMKYDDDTDFEFELGGDCMSFDGNSVNQTAAAAASEDDEEDDEEHDVDEGEDIEEETGILPSQLDGIRETLRKGGSAYQFLNPLVEQLLSNAESAEAICVARKYLNMANTEVLALKYNETDKQSQGTASLPRAKQQSNQRLRKKQSSKVKEETETQIVKTNKQMLLNLHLKNLY